MDDADEATDRAPGIDDDRVRGRSGGGAGPGAEQAIGQGGHILAAEVATDDQRRSCRVERPLVGAAELRGRQRLDGRAGPAGRSMVGRGRRVDRVDERLFDATSRIRLRLEEVVQSLVAKAFDLGRSGRSGATAPRRRARGPAPADRTGHRRRRSGRPSRPRRGATRRVARSASTRAIASYDSVPSDSARAARTVAPASSAGSSAAPPRTMIDADTSGRPGRSTTSNDRPLDSRAARDGREVVGSRGARLRPVGDDPAVTWVEGRAHAATSSSLARRVGLVRWERHVVGGRSLGQIRQDQPVVRPEDGSSDIPDRLRGHRQIARQHPVDEPRVVEQRRVHRQPIRSFLHALERTELVGLRERLRPGELVVAHELGRQSGQLLVEGRLDPCHRDPGSHRRPARGDRRAADEPHREERHVLRDPFLPDQSTVEATALARRRGSGRPGRARRGGGRRRPARGTRRGCAGSGTRSKTVSRRSPPSVGGSDRSPSRGMSASAGIAPK